MFVASQPEIKTKEKFSLTARTTYSSHGYLAFSLKQQMRHSSFQFILGSKPHHILEMNAMAAAPLF